MTEVQAKICNAPLTNWTLESEVAITPNILQLLHSSYISARNLYPGPLIKCRKHDKANVKPYRATTNQHLKLPVRRT